MSSARCLLLAGVVVVLTGCYRPAAPPPLDGGLRIQIVTNHGKLVRAQSMLQREVARSCRRRLGWRTAPNGINRLALTLAGEDIEASAHDALDIPSRWSLVLQGSWELHRPGHPPMRGRFSGTGSASNRGQELRALEDAAETVADLIATTIEQQLIRQRLTTEESS
ncbi:MAG: hypothetical protein ACOCZK_04685 [Planctomycetota bacterium]